jgi:hypothetical protein
VKVYLAGEREAFSKANGEMALWAKVVKRRLFSYFYHGFKDSNKPSRDIRDSAAAGLDLFLDSGAFTAFTKKAVIDVARYAEFIRCSPEIWSAVSSLDAIGDPEKSYEYFCQLQEMDCPVRPVFHCREPTYWLERYLDEGNDYIFLGGMVPETTVWLTEWLDDLWGNYLTDSHGVPKVKVHGFGLTDQRLIFRYPWYSVDSTSWLMIGVYGSCALLDTDAFGTRVLRKIIFSEDSPQRKDDDSWHYTQRNSWERQKIDRMLERFGVTAQQCASHYSYRDMVNAATYQEMEAEGIHTFIRRPGIW